ncbi:alcohol dehydrogenase catalytic domain-containing protein [Metabacillus schmidteae]|uniref:alcohol dehydrogenase catalytic domain-containing protein n=1 Tax=Metabacillus schmidteae TaxID=2730405 RepID=UPI00158E9845|nr:alcohol dehydrogenase catalytic domain-containing protein [Metabacillus schmidteae]
MRAVTYQGFMDVKVKDMPDPQIKNKDDLIVKVTHSSICGSDRHFYHGMVPSMKKDYIVGHEAVGNVHEIGSEVHHLKKGDKVVLPYNIACGKCINCKNNLESQCIRSNQGGEIGGCYGCSRLFGDYNGTQAEFVRVPYANYGTFKVPEHNEVKDEELLLLTDAYSSAYWGIQQAGVKSGDTVIVLGCGPLGLITQKLAWFKGAKRVIAVDHVAYRLEHANKWNHVEVFNFKENKELKSHLKEITKGGADVVIDCVGMSGKMKTLEIMETALRFQGGALGAIEFASQVVLAGGTIQLMGIYGTRYNQFPLGDLFARNITLKMGLASVTHLIPYLYELLQTKQLDLMDVITHHFPLEESEHAYRIFNAHKEKCLKVILEP